MVSYLAIMVRQVMCYVAMLEYHLIHVRNPLLQDCGMRHWEVRTGGAQRRPGNGSQSLLWPYASQTRITHCP